MSPFFQAMKAKKVWALDLFCDNGADLTVKNSAHTFGEEKVCMPFP